MPDVIAPRGEETDEMLMERVKTGDRTAFAMLVARNSHQVYRLAHRLLVVKGDAEDLVQEVMVTLWTRPQWWDGARNVKFTTWLYRVTMNRCIDYNRRVRSAVSCDEIAEMQDTSPRPDQQWEETRRAMGLQQAMNQLPERQKQAIVLCHLEEMNHAEAAEILGTTAKSIESLVARGRKQLKKVMTAMMTDYSKNNKKKRVIQ